MRKTIKNIKQRKKKQNQRKTEKSLNVNWFVQLLKSLSLHCKKYVSHILIDR